MSSLIKRNSKRRFIRCLRPPWKYLSIYALSHILYSIEQLGALLSAPVVGFLMDRIGRKHTMMLLSLPFVLGWLLIGFATNLAMILAGRFITGMQTYPYIRVRKNLVKGPSINYVTRKGDRVNKALMISGLYKYVTHAERGGGKV